MTSTAPHQALYRRWRAQTFSQIVGQEAVVETLRNAVRTDRVSHAILFVGPRGTGKTSLARILAKAVNCTNLQDGDPCDACEACVAVREGTTLDVLEIDAASNRGINEVRDLRDRLAYPPGHLRRKVYILDEAHQITRDAWNALLKSLEEPPDFVIFMFASTEPSGFPPAILSRLQRYDVRRLTVPEIEGKLTRILEADGRTIEPAGLTLIARLAAGGMRDAESILDQLLSTSTDTDRPKLPSATCSAWPTRPRSMGSSRRCRPATSRPASPSSTRSRSRGRDPRALLDQVVDAVRARLIDPTDRRSRRARRGRPPARGDRSGPGRHRRASTAARAGAVRRFEPRVDCGPSHRCPRRRRRPATVPASTHRTPRRTATGPGQGPDLHAAAGADPSPCRRRPRSSRSAPSRRDRRRPPASLLRNPRSPPDLRNPRLRASSPRRSVPRSPCRSASATTSTASSPTGRPSSGPPGRRRARS